MKKIAIATIAAITALAPVTATSALAAPGYQRIDNHRGDYRGRPDARQQRQNGYWAGGRFYRGEPTRAQRSARDFRYDYRQWRRGERLNTWERGHYSRVADYRAYRLQAPPRGYEWRRTNTGDFVLAAVATGLIMSVILAAGN
ncbi:MAG: RcnB family protein [Hyphomonadaceae bacterium]|nr:RcnB family protein [Hyphomonadaceae bacterium]